MLVKGKFDGRLYSAGHSTIVGNNNIRIVKALSKTNPDQFIIEDDLFRLNYEPTEPRPFVRHLRMRSGDVPFATVIATDSKTFYFSKCHWRDQYCKKEGIRSAMANGSMNKKEFIAKVEALLSYNDKKAYERCFLDVPEMLDIFFHEVKEYFIYFS